MANYFHLYTNNPTAGAADGTQVSEDHAFTAPISAVLNATEAESSVIKMAIRCAEGFATVGSTVLKKLYYDGSTTAETGGNINKWAFAPDLSTPARNTYTITTNAASGDTVAIGDVSLTAGTDFTVGSNIATTAANIAAAINSKSTLYTASASDAVITVTEKYAGAGNVLTNAVVTGTIAITNGIAVVSAAATAETMNTSGVWGDTITFSDSIEAKNKIFWLKVTSIANETPQKDTTTVINGTATIQAV